MLVAGDIGGTKTELAIYSNESGPHPPLAQTEFHSADHPSLQAMARSFIVQPAALLGAAHSESNLKNREEAKAFLAPVKLV